MKNHEKLLALSKMMPFGAEITILSSKVVPAVWQIDVIDSPYVEYHTHNGSFGAMTRLNNVKPILHPFSKLNEEVTVPNELAVSLLADVGVEVKVGDKVNALEVIALYFVSVYFPIHKWIITNNDKVNQISLSRVKASGGGKVLVTIKRDTLFLWLRIDRESIDCPYCIYLKTLDILRSLRFAVDFPEGEFEVIK